METINAKTIATVEHFRSFLTRCNDEILIIVNNERTVTCNKRNFFDTFFELEVSSDVDAVECRSAEVVLLLVGYDVTWWRQNSRRKNKLLKIYEDMSAYSTKQFYNVAVATLTDDGISQVKVFNGTKQDIIPFFNTEIKKRYIDNFLQQKIVFNLCYAIGDEDNPQTWFTLEELQDNNLVQMR